MLYNLPDLSASIIVIFLTDSHTLATIATLQTRFTPFA